MSTQVGANSQTGAGADLAQLGRLIKQGAPELAKSSTSQRNTILTTAATLLEEGFESILAANAMDLERAKGQGVSSSVTDRLALTKERVLAMAQGLRQVSELEDPIGEVLSGWTQPNGISITKIAVPLGVVAIIYENRPNVTSDAFGLCIKSANAAFLRGSQGALESNKAIVALLRQALSDCGFSSNCVTLVEDVSYENAAAFMKMRGVIDVLIPRGGPSLIKSVLENATVPTIIDGDGNCHLFVDESADLDMALSILVNGKTQRPSVCNALESLIVHASIANKFLPMMSEAMSQVELVGDQASIDILGVSRVALATESDFASEFLDLKLSIAIVDNLEKAIEHIDKNGTGHTEVIVTSNADNAEKFLAEVDAAAVVVNASSRFTDGEQFGFGAEIGISTQKLHARGPMGLRELTSYKYVVRGEGQVRS